MPAYMYDGAYAPNLATCKRHGAIAMSHYMTRGYASTSAQPDAIRAAGMGVVFNWEGAANELVGATRTRGQLVGREALAALPAAVPRDNTVKITYSVDVDLTNLAAADNAFRGINDAHKGTGVLVGVYGEGGLIERLHGLGLVQGGQWLSMSEGFGGFQHALASGLVAVVQMHDAAGHWIGTDIPNTDRNTVIDPHGLGAWWPAGSPYATAAAQPTPASTTAPAAIPAPEGDTEMLLVVVDKDECTAKKVPWPGYFVFDGVNLTHVVPSGTKTTNNVTSLAKRLGPAVEVSLSQYHQWGGK